MNSFMEFYDWAEGISDPRVANWLLIPSPMPTILFVLVYVLFVKWIGPMLMEYRKPFSLQYALVIYNAGLMFLNLYIFTELVLGAVSAGYSFPCQPVVTSNDPKHIRIAAALWWYYFSKVIELLDTVFFVLRKRNCQISFLHVYHHATMPLLWWIGVKWVPCGHSLYAASLNSFVHVVMYTYYGMSALGPEFQKYLWWKHNLTQLQLFQFFFALGHSTYSWYTNCPFPNWMYHALNCYLISFIILFGNFYVQAYINRQRLYTRKRLDTALNQTASRPAIPDEHHMANGMNKKRN